MVTRQRVGSRYTEYPLVLLGISVAACTALVAYGTAIGKMPPAFVGATGGVATLFLLRGWFVARGRRWVSPTEQGFILEDRHGGRAVADADISDLATKSSVYYANGVPKAIVRRGTIVLRDGQVPFHYDFPLDKPDPLQFLLDRVLPRLTDQAAAAIASGGSLHGDRWELSKDGMVVRSGAGEMRLANEDVVAAEVLTEHLCVWVRGEEQPSARIPVGSVNALILLTLLEKVLKANSTDRGDSVGGLGRVLFERGRTATPPSLFLVVLLFAGSGIGIGGWYGGVGGAVLGALAGCVVGSPVFLAEFLYDGYLFRCHTRGVCRRTYLTSQELRFEDVGTFTYSAIRIYVNGGYACTDVRMKFAPRAGVDGRAVKLRTSIKNADVELESLREHVSRMVGAHMLHRLGTGESVRWTDGLRFRQEGLEWTKSGGLFSRSATRLIPYEEIAGTDIQEGLFYLFLRDVKKAVYTAHVSADNFFPGLVMLEMIRYRAPVGGAAEF